MKISKFKLLIPLALSILLSACAPVNTSEGAENTLIATVSILPQKYFLERIGGDYIEVNVMVGPGESPHSYEPKVKQMISLSKSAVYFTIGVEFEDAWMERITSANPDMRIVDLTENITKIPAFAHNHKGTDSHDEEEMDPHVWTSPTMGSIIARDIFTVLVKLDPLHTDDYQTNLNALLKDIERLQVDITASLSTIDNNKFMVFHPAWGYFAQEFDLEQIPIEVGGTEPSASELAQIIDTAKKEGIHVIFAQPEFSTKSANYIASEIGGRVILISPLAEDWLENLRLVSQTLAPSLTH